MRLTLITVVFLLHGQPFAATPIATEKPANKAVASTHHSGATKTRMQFQPGQEASRLKTVQGAPAASQAAQHPSAAKDTNEPEGRSYATLLAALALMAAIAVRRLLAGRP